MCREALTRVRAKGVRVRLLVPTLLYPVAEEVYREFFHGARGGLVVEQSYQGQLYRVLRMFIDVPAGVVSLARPGANPFVPAEVVARLRDLAVALQRVPGDAHHPAE